MVWGLVDVHMRKGRRIEKKGRGWWWSVSRFKEVTINFMQEQWHDHHYHWYDSGNRYIFKCERMRIKLKAGYA